MKTRRRNSTGANRGNGEGILCSFRFLLLNSGRDGDADFIFPARDTASTAPACRAEVGRRRKSDESWSPCTDNIACLPSIALAVEGANTKPSMSKATPRLACSAMRSW